LNYKLNNQIQVYIISELLPPLPSGAAKRAVRTAMKFDSYQVNPLFFTRTPNPDLKLGFVSISPYIEIGGKKISKIINLVTLITIGTVQLFRHKKPDIIHSYSVSWLTILVFLYNRLFWKSPFIIDLTLLKSDTAGSTRKWFIYRKLSDYCLRNADKLNALSPAISKLFIKKGFPEDKLSNITGSVDVEDYKLRKRHRVSIRKMYNINDQTIVLLTVAGITHRKGYDLIEKILANLPPYYDFHWFFVGNYSAPFQKKIVSNICCTAKKYGIEKKITFTGYTKALPYYSAADIFVFCSKLEGLPSSILEAMSCELPIIARNISDITDFIISDNETGFIIEDDDEMEFVQKILKLSNDSELRNMFAQNAKRRAKSRFDLKIISKQYVELYHTMLKE